MTFSLVDFRIKGNIFYKIFKNIPNLSFNIFY